MLHVSEPRHARQQMHHRHCRRRRELQTRLGATAACLRIPASIYLRKPFVGAELIEAVRSRLSHSGSSNPTHN